MSMSLGPITLFGSKNSSCNANSDSSSSQLEIDFWKPKKLSDDVVAFKIRNADRDVVGYAVASSISSFDILGTDYGKMEEQTDIAYLRKQLQKFCEVYYAEKSEN